MAGFSPALPFRRDSINGIALTQTMLEVIRQNLKNLVLTNPGERVMLTDFGVGINRYLFEMNNNITSGDIRGKINEQVKKYMPFISIRDVKYISDDDMYEAGQVNLSILYHIAPLDYADVLNIQI